jgi:NADH:ubiquinone reductase (H+-translocating)
VQNRISTVASWLTTIGRARRTDRTFTLGNTTSPEHPYNWLKIMHPNMIHHTTEAISQTGATANPEVRGGPVVDADQ